MTAYNFEMGMTLIGPTSLSIPLRPAKFWNGVKNMGRLLGRQSHRYVHHTSKFLVSKENIWSEWTISNFIMVVPIKYKSFLKH